MDQEPTQLSIQEVNSVYTTLHAHEHISVASTRASACVSLSSSWWDLKSSLDHCPVVEASLVSVSHAAQHFNRELADI